MLRVACAREVPPKNKSRLPGKFRFCLTGVLSQNIVGITLFYKGTIVRGVPTVGDGLIFVGLHLLVFLLTQSSGGV